MHNHWVSFQYKYKMNLLVLGLFSLLAVTVLINLLTCSYPYQFPIRIGFYLFLELNAESLYI